MPAIIQVVDGRPRIIIGGGAIEAAFLAQQAAMAFAEAVGESADAAAGSASAAATSASNASGSASAAAGSAGMASGAATVATTKASEAEDSADAASGSASTAETQAGIATGAANTATTKAGEAADSAAEAIALVLPISSEPEAIAGAVSNKSMSPLRVKQAVDAQVPPMIAGKADLTLANSPNVNTVLSSDTLTYPIGNELETYSQFNVFAADRHDDKREFLFNYSATFTHGPNPYVPDPEDHWTAKVVHYWGAHMRLDCKKAWTLNPLLTIKEDCVDPQWACVAEFDIDNFKRHFGAGDGWAGLGGPTASGILIHGSNATNHTVTAGAMILGPPVGGPIFNRGYMVGPNAVVQASFDDYSSAGSSYRDQGTHVIGLNLKGTYSSAGISVSGAAPVGVSTSGAKSISGLLDTSVAPRGLQLQGSYARTAIHAPLPGYANDAAAAAAGLIIGDFYQAGGVVRQRIT